MEVISSKKNLRINRFKEAFLNLPTVKTSKEKSGKGLKSTPMFNSYRSSGHNTQLLKKTYTLRSEQSVINTSKHGKVDLEKRAIFLKGKIKIQSRSKNSFSKDKQTLRDQFLTERGKSLLNHQVRTEHREKEKTAEFGEETIKKIKVLLRHEKEVYKFYASARWIKDLNEQLKYKVARLELQKNGTYHKALNKLIGFRTAGRAKSLETDYLLFQN